MVTSFVQTLKIGLGVPGQTGNLPPPLEPTPGGDQFTAPFFSSPECPKNAVWHIGINNFVL